MTRVLSVDIGERNFAYCAWSAARGFYDMQVVDLRQIKGDSATRMRTLQERGVFDDCDVVLVERQMRSKFKEMATAIRCFNWDKTVLVAPQSVKRAFKTGTGKHATNKKAHVALARAKNPDVKLLVHPECRYEVVTQADEVGSTSYIIKVVENAPAGSTIAVGTEIHLVNRLAEENPDKTIVSLDPLICPCSTMNRIDLPHLAWVLEELVAGRVQNRISVDEDTTEWARVALQRMLDIP